MTLFDLKDVIKISEEQFGEKGWSKPLFLDDLNKEFKFAYVLKTEKSKVQEKEKIVAFIIFLQTEGESGLEVNITNLAVQEKYKRLGNATFLINFMKQFSKQKKVKKVWLEVNENNLPAINLYKKSGFKTDYIRKSYYSNGENALIMSFELTE